MQNCPAFERGGCTLSCVIEVKLDYFPEYLHNRLTSPNYHKPRLYACLNCHTSFVEYTVNLDTNYEQRTTSILGTTHTQTQASHWFNFNAWVK